MEQRKENRDLTESLYRQIQQVADEQKEIRQMIDETRKRVEKLEKREEQIRIESQLLDRRLVRCQSNSFLKYQ